MNARPITEDDLHALVDGALDGLRQTEVERYLSEHGDVALRVEGYRQQRAALRAALKPIADEPVPPQLGLARMIEDRRRPRALWWQSAAAAVVFALGSVTGWSMHVPGSSGGAMMTLAQEAATNYTVYGPDRLHPVEVRASDKDDLSTWIASRLGRSVALPDLSALGYRFMGGRVVATAQGPAGMLMYDDDKGTRIVMLVRPMKDGADSRMTEHENGDVAGFTWANEGLGYSLVGSAPAATLHPLADEVRRQTQKI
jgi:anti-sigma factor RsiW